jgi:hypothetical protein
MLISELINFRETLFNMPIFGGLMQQAWNLGEWLGEWVSGLGGWLSGAFEWIGESTVAGWVRGLWSRAQDLWDTLIEMARRAWEAVRNFFDSRSPSRLMYWLGQTLPQGAALGVRDDTPRFVAAATDMADAFRREVEREHRFAIRLRPGMRREMPDLRSRTISVRTVGSRAEYDYRREAELRAYAMAVRAQRMRESADRPVEVTIPVYVGGKKFDERVIEVTKSEAREARRARGQMAAPGYGR